MGPVKPGTRRRKNPRATLGIAPTKVRKRRAPLNLRTTARTIESTRVNGVIFSARFRRLLPLDPSDLTEVHRWFARKLRDNRRRKHPFRWAFATLHLRTLGPLYEAKPIDEGAPEWTDTYVNLAIINTETGKTQLNQDLPTLFETKLDWLDFKSLHGRAAYLQGVRIEFFDVKPGAPVPNTPEWKGSKAPKVRNV